VSIGFDKLGLPVIRTDCRFCGLRHSRGFSDLDENDLILVSNTKSKHDKAEAGQWLSNQAEHQIKVFTLFSGLAAEYHTLPSGQRHLSAVLLPGDLVGMDSLAFGASYSGVIALTDVTFCSFRADNIANLLASERLAERLLRAQALAARQLIGRAAAMATRDAKANIAHFLVRLYDRLLQRNLAQHNSFKTPLTYRHLGDATGLTPGHVLRSLQSLNQAGLLTLSRGAVVFHDLPRLRLLSGAQEEDPIATPLV
jgi:CRP-like cAMP-binding protein